MPKREGAWFSACVRLLRFPCTRGGIEHLLSLCQFCRFRSCSWTDPFSVFAVVEDENDKRAHAESFIFHRRTFPPPIGMRSPARAPESHASHVFGFAQSLDLLRKFFDMLSKPLVQLYTLRQARRGFLAREVRRKSRAKTSPPLSLALSSRFRRTHLTNSMILTRRKLFTFVVLP